MDKKIVVLFLLAFLLAFPVVVLAIPQFNPVTIGIEADTITKLIDKFITYIIWPIAAAVSVIMFIVAGFEFLTAHGDPTKLKTGKGAVIWGIVGVVVILLSFSVIAFLGALTGAIPPPPPQGGGGGGQCTNDADCIFPAACLGGQCVNPDQNPPPAAKGACCAPVGGTTCLSNYTKQQCEDPNLWANPQNAGSWKGEGTVCAPNPCP